jgi:hypothetical protein
LFLALNAKGGESNGSKQKDRTTTLFSKKLFQKGGEIIHKEEKLIGICKNFFQFQIICKKTLLTAKGRTSSGGAFI